jgi:hypothetical protein
MPDYSVFKPIRREEWEQGLEGSIRLGLAKPGETYDDYLAAAAIAFSRLELNEDEDLDPANPRQQLGRETVVRFQSRV